MSILTYNLSKYFTNILYRHVRNVSKWTLNYSIIIHNGDLIYILNNIETQTNEIKKNDDVISNKKATLSISHVYGETLNYTKNLKSLPK
jgi:hypothetical protein